MDKENFRLKTADFFKTEHQKLVRYVRRLIDDAADRDSEDIIQDVFLNIFNLGDVTIPVENLAAYVYRSLKNRIIDILKRRKNESVPLDYLEFSKNVSAIKNGNSSKDHLHMEMENREMRDSLFTAIDSLRDEYREIITLTELEGKSFKEVSVAMNVPVGTLLSRKSRAMKILQNKLNDKKEVL
jgi:RNA polymerase sigma factor (sigma-70 family)